MRIDMHTHPLFKHDEHTYTTLNKFLKQMDRARMDKAVLLPVDSIPEQLDVMLRDAKYRYHFYQSFKQESDSSVTYDEFKEDARSFLKLGITNEIVRDLCNEHPDRFIGFGSVNPHRPEKEIEETIDKFLDWGFKGIKLMPTLMFFDPEDDKMNVIYEKSQDCGLVLVFHTGCDPGPWEHFCVSSKANPKYLAKAAGEFPSLQMVAAHLGSYSKKSPGIWWEEMMEVMEEYDNVHADIAALRPSVLFGNKKLLSQTIERVGYDRILFGSDYPTVNRFPMYAAADRIDISNITGKEHIMGENARRLLDI